MFATNEVLDEACDLSALTPEIDEVAVLVIFSYDGGLYFGVTGDYDSSSDVDILTTGGERSISELLVSLAPTPTDRPRAARRKRPPSRASRRLRHIRPS